MQSLTKVKNDDVFTLEIPRRKLAATNALWNSLGLNSPLVIGQVTGIIQQREFADRKDWMHYYFTSGEQRQALMEGLTPAERRKIDTADKSKMTYLSKPLRELNTTHGRTVDDLKRIGSVLFDAVEAKGNPQRITRIECNYMVFFRVVCDTWNGLIQRERNTVKTFQTVLGEAYAIEKTAGDVDVRYEVDCEIRQDGTLIAGLQIKPDSYRKQFANNSDAYAINKKKNDAYTRDFGAPVLYVYAKMDGTVLNPEVFEALAEQIDKCFTLAY